MSLIIASPISARYPIFPPITKRTCDGRKSKESTTRNLPIILNLDRAIPIFRVTDRTRTAITAGDMIHALHRAASATQMMIAIVEIGLDVEVLAGRGGGGLGCDHVILRLSLQGCGVGFGLHGYCSSRRRRVVGFTVVAVVSCQHLFRCMIAARVV